ncbi:MAG: GrpB family protein [Oscillospiraceae bacterium]|nr:GrpB family protein [Oscillospiraceae bacterium]
MNKNLSEMTNDELWQLFPIKLCAHRASWATQYAREEARLLPILLPLNLARISHVGSTAVDGILAKPIVDILVELEKGADMSAVDTALVEAGYRSMSHEPGRISFNRGYTEEGFAEEVFHLHLRFCGDNDELYFRDLLRDRPDVALLYEKLKKRLKKKYTHNRDAYTDGKTEFIRRYTEEAREMYRGRYG